MAEVTQADREAMADLFVRIGRVSQRDADNIRAGEWDDIDDLKWFARHRTEAVKPLVEALERMVYEATHLSPCKPNGDHDCTIKADALEQARAALRGAKIAGGA
jgi:hypothetical protein